MWVLPLFWMEVRCGRMPGSLEEKGLYNSGAGGGIRYQSPIGPIRIDIGYKLNPTDEDLNIYEGTDYGSKWSRIGIHFSIGQAF